MVEGKSDKKIHMMLGHKILCLFLWVIRTVQKYSPVWTILSNKNCLILLDNDKKDPETSSK